MKLDKVEMREFTFKVQTVLQALALGKGLKLQAERAKIDFHNLGAYQLAVGMFQVLTQEEQVYEFPNNFLIRWGSWWQKAKLQWLPHWVLRRFPPKETKVWLQHNFPEATVPDFGREFVKVKLIDVDVLKKALERKDEKE